MLVSEVIVMAKSYIKDDAMNNPYDGFDVIYTYTREQAIEEGVLIDVSEMASEAGFKWPVAVTVNV